MKSLIIPGEAYLIEESGKGAQQRSFGLDFARASAIMLVLISHMGHRNYETLGFWGVELFFALSGFLIGGILWRTFSERPTWRFAHVLNFWSRRWWRTLPNYYLFLILMLAFQFFGKSGSPSLSRLLSFLWFGQNLLSHTYDFYPVSWSLCIEEWFYILFPLGLFVFHKTGLKASVSFTATLVLFITTSLIIRMILINSGKENSLREITFARLDSIACGVIIAFLFSKFSPGVIWRQICFLTGLIPLVFAWYNIYFENQPYELITQSSLWLLIAPLSFALMLPQFSTLKAPAGSYKFISKGIEKISLWSYSIYLCHIPVMWIVYKSMNRIRGNDYGNLFSKIIALIITIIISSLVFKYIEAPFILRRPKELKF